MGVYGFLLFWSCLHCFAAKDHFLRLLEVLCQKGGVIWEYHQSYRLRVGNGVQSLRLAQVKAEILDCYELIGE